MSDTEVFIPFIQLRPSAVVIFTRYVGARKSRHDWESMYEDNRPEELKAADKKSRPLYSGTFTRSARKRMLCALDCLILLSPARKIYNPIAQKTHTFQMSFITLTYSCADIVDYKDSMRHLEQFLKWLTRTAGARLYVWRLEIQKRGQIHFHIVTEAFIRYDAIRDKWNSIQQKAGLIERGMNPNSTDIKSAISVSDVAAYVSKYMAKEDKEPTNYTGSEIKKFYGTSQNLQGAKRPTFDCTQTKGSLSALQEMYRALNYWEFSPSEYSIYVGRADDKQLLSPSRLAMRVLKIQKEFEEWKKDILPDLT